MTSPDLFASHQWELFGSAFPFFTLEAETVTYTWVVMGLLFVLGIAARLCLLYHPSSMVSYVLKMGVRFALGMLEDSCKCIVPQRYVSFFCTLLLFLLVCNCLIIIPMMEEPTRDLNTTLALSLIVFLFVQVEAAYKHGLLRYVNEFFKTPLQVFGLYHSLTVYTFCMMLIRSIINIILGTIMLPLELLGKLSSIIALAFRLFGNILAGSIIASVWAQFRSGSLLLQMAGLLTGFNLLIIMFFGIFEGCVQAFVFVMLSVSALGRALSHQD